MAILAALLLCAVAYLWGYPHMEASLFKTEVSTTEVSLLSPSQGAVDLTTTGYVVAERSSKVGAKVPGRLATVLVKEGDVVKAGAVLATLEDVDQRAALSTARARLLSARARAQAARANLAEGQIRATRERTLAIRGAAAMASAQDQEARVKALDELVRAADTEIGASEAEVSAAGQSLSQMTITAPMAGTVVTRPLRPGELVGPGTAPVLELADFSSLVVETDVPEGRLGRVRPKAPCEISLDAFPGKRLRGETLEIVPRVNRAKATVLVKVRFSDPTEGVLPDMAARVSFLQSALSAQAMKEAPRLVVPQSAVAERGGSKVVFVIDGDRVRMTPVALGPPFAGGFELKGPPTLLAGTRLVASPPPVLQDGRKIKERSE